MLTMAFLCERQMTLENTPVKVSIDTIWKQELNVFQDRSDIISKLKRFQTESNFIEISGDNISLTQSGINHCRERQISRTTQSRWVICRASSSPVCSQRYRLAIFTIDLARQSASGPPS